MRAIRPVLLAALLVLAVTAPPSPARPDRVYQPLAITLADGNLHLVLFINTTRAAFCTPEWVQWEEDVIRGRCGRSAGTTRWASLPILTQTTQTRHGTDYSEQGKGLVGEVWRMMPDPPAVGPYRFPTPQVGSWWAPPVTRLISRTSMETVRSSTTSKPW